MKNISAYKVISYVSLLLAIIFFYEFIKELMGGMMISDFSPIALIVASVLIFNTILSVLMVSKFLKRRFILAVCQTAMIILNIWALYQIYTSVEVCINSQIVS
ncbi:hypothetical protein CEY12_04720 [Chryseobacterium sp. T16E-39]|nr:hypothetical protein CEY12_04720 [Chryseobacterium sp. T16E-39]